MLAVVVNIQAVPGREEELIVAMQANATGSRRESGCLKWEWSRHITDPARFAIYELYVDAGAFEQHKASHHFEEWKESTADLIAVKESGQFDVMGLDPRPVP